MVKKRYRTWKVVIFWILGAIFAMFATWITSQTPLEFETTSYLSLFLAFFLFLIAGILWIAVAVAIKESE